MDHKAQILDSIDTPGNLVTEIWAPLGLRYHAVHHYFPGIPYHNLGKAYRQLTATQGPLDATVSPSLLASHWRLWRPTVDH